MISSDNYSATISGINESLAEGKKLLKAAGLSGSARSYFLAGFLKDLQKPCLVILPEEQQAERLYKELAFFMSTANGGSEPAEGRLHMFAAYELSPLTGLSPDREAVTRRLEALYSLTAETNPIVIVSLDAIAGRILPKEKLLQACDLLATGEEIDREAFLNRLETNGFRRTALVEERGDYSVRGGVVDVYAPLYPRPLRLEFWGDVLESIRSFEPVSQRSQDHMPEMVLLPASEIIADREALQIARSMGRLPGPLEIGVNFPGREAWLNHFYSQPDSLFDYLPDEALACLIDSHRFESRMERISQQAAGNAEKFRQEAAEKGTPFPEVAGLQLGYDEIARRIEAVQRLEFSTLSVPEADSGGEIFNVGHNFHLDENFELRLSSRGRVSLAPMAERISAWLASGARVVLVSRTEQQAERLIRILENYAVRTNRVVQRWTEVPRTAGLWICIGRLSRGFNWPETGLYVISEDEILGAKRARAPSKRSAPQNVAQWYNFSRLAAGDLVVHEEHGVGRYIELLKMEINNRIKEFVLVKYARGDKLYIPADRISVLQKYVGIDGGNIKLDRLGGRSWDVAKQKAKRSVKKIAKQLIELYALRKYRRGNAFSAPDNYYREFEATFEHEETSDQIKAIEDVLDDMTSEKPMDRLICGDVGFGKTEIALRAAFKSVSDGKQVAMLVPTTVLAEQHFETFHRRMEAYRIRVAILSRFKTARQQSEILARLRSGKIDVIIGTHRLLQKDVKFRDLGLIILDEEQRFGVKQKEALKRYRALVDVLALTATPIPRTFQMSLLGVRDLSIIETPPDERHAIESYLSSFDEGLIKRAVDFEVERGGQVFFVHNRVQTISALKDHLTRIVPGATFAVAHGQMKERELEKTMLRFLRKEIDVLVCTTIVESGLDIPSANTIIINEADRLGLAQIYQLRGRVGRSKEKAYAYLLVAGGTTMTRDAEKRLKALMDFSNLGAGLQLAMHDLKIRGGGNILGFAQAGHITAVGYELYLKLIEQAIAELKGEQSTEVVNPEINLDLPAFFPENYVSDTDIRLNLYRRLSTLNDKSELDAITEEIRDRFGPPPPEVGNLLGVMSIRLLLKGLRVNRLDMGAAGFTLSFAAQNQVDTQRLVRLAEGSPQRYQFLAQNRLKVLLGRIVPEEQLPRIEEAVRVLSGKSPA